MKILHVTSTYPPHVGGVEGYVHQLVNKQRLLGNDTYVITSNLSNNDFSEANVIRLPVLYNFKGSWGEMPICPTILGALKKMEWDVFHGHISSKFFSEAIAINRLFAKKKKPLIVTYHVHNEVLTSFKRALWYVHNMTIMRAFLKAADTIIVPTNNYRTLLSKFFRVNSEKVEVIPPGVDVEKFNPRKYQPEHAREKFRIFEENVIVFVGRLVSAKGIDHLIEALPIIRENICDISLVIVGEGLYKTELQALSRKLKVDGVVRFISELSHKEIPQVMSLANVIVHPSLTETFGLVPLEAMSMEKPVVATRVGGIPEVVVHGQTGFLVEKGDINELAKAIVSILSSRKTALGMGKLGRKLILEKYSWDTVTRRILKTYENALATYA